jgi:cysteine desulfurase family protein (TIGR01976 family)
MPLAIDFVRRQFPVFQNSETARWAFFENAGGSYVPRQVIDRLTHFFEYTKVQPYGPFPASAAAGEAMDAGYRAMAALLNADADALTLGPSTTMNTYVLAQAVRPLLAPGDEIIVTNQDHEANIGCWRRLEEFGAVVREWPIDPVSGELNPADLEPLVSDRTRLVCFTLCSNIVGSMNDVAAVCRLAGRVGALTVGDGVSFAPHRLFDAGRTPLDVYLFSTYKTFGTHIGVMWIRPEVAARLRSQGHYFNDDKPRYRLNPAGPLHAEIAALAGITDYLETLYDHHFGHAAADAHSKVRQVFDLFALHETRLANRLLDTLRSMPDVRIVGRPVAETGRRAATISFVKQGMPSEMITRRLAENRIAARHGHFYALRCLEALGIRNPETSGVVRISLVHYNTNDDVSRLADALQSLG